MRRDAAVGADRQGGGGETVVITRHGRPLWSALVAEEEVRRARSAGEIFDRCAPTRAKRPKVTVEEILRDEGRGPSILMAIVIDASIAAAWVYPDEDSAVARRPASSCSTRVGLVPSPVLVRDPQPPAHRRASGSGDLTASSAFLARLDPLPLDVDRSCPSSICSSLLATTPCPPTMLPIPSSRRAPHRRSPRSIARLVAAAPAAGVPLGQSELA